MSSAKWHLIYLGWFCLSLNDTLRLIDTYASVSPTIIGSDNGLSPNRRQVIIWTNAGILSVGSLGINFGEVLLEIQTFSFMKMHLKMSSAKWRPFCLCLNVLKCQLYSVFTALCQGWHLAMHCTTERWCSQRGGGHSLGETAQHGKKGTKDLNKEGMSLETTGCSAFVD